MAIKKAYALLVDVETCLDGTVFDFAYLLVRKSTGEIIKQGAYIVLDNCKKPLFSLSGSQPDKANFFSVKSLNRRTEAYRAHVRAGTRTIRSVESINAELALISCNYNPTFISYNLQFDWNACLKSNIPVDRIFKNKACLMQACIELYMPRLSFRRFCLLNGCFSPKNYMSYTAETLYKYLSGDNNYKEPHQALEDLTTCEHFIFCHVIRQKKKIKNTPMNWQKIHMTTIYASLQGAAT